MQIKATMRYHLTTHLILGWLVYNFKNISNTENSKYWQGCREIETSELLLRMQNGVATMGNNMDIPQKIKTKTTL